MSDFIDSFGVRSTLRVGGTSYRIWRLDALKAHGMDPSRLPYGLKVLLENLLRTEGNGSVSADDVRALASWDPNAQPSREIAFTPSRVLLQDYTGIPAVVDLASMRTAMEALGGDPERINPLVPVELVIDHSVVVDEFAHNASFRRNQEIEYQRNAERYKFLRWGQAAFRNFRVVPPDTGIVHQVNLEYLARGVFTREADGMTEVYPDTCLGADSHTPMVNSLGVVGWGVGGIEAEAAMLGQPVSMLIPRVVGFKLRGSLSEGSTATDLVLTITEMLRKHGVVGKFVEFYGEGVAAVSLANRATIGNMSPEFGSTISIFPIDEETLRYMRFTGRSEEHVALVKAYAQAQGLWHDPAHESQYSETLELDLGTVEPSIAGPKRPQDRIALSRAKSAFADSLAALSGLPRSNPAVVRLSDGTGFEIDHGAVVIAAITSCTNTSNPAVMIAAGLLAKKAVERGLRSKPWVKTSLAPGSRVVADYYARAGLSKYMDQLGFNLVGYGCTTCIGNSGPLIPEVSEAVRANGLAVASVLSGNRNFEGRIHSEVKMNYLMSPPLVVVYALTGSMDFDLYDAPLGQGSDGMDVYLRDIWPTAVEVQAVIESSISADMYTQVYSNVFDGGPLWDNLPTPEGSLYQWEPESTYVRNPPYFEGLHRDPDPVTDVHGARVLAMLGDSVNTDYINPAGAILRGSPAADYLDTMGTKPSAYSSYGARRGNYEVMIRDTLTNDRLRNRVAPETEGGFTRDFTQQGGPVTSIFEASRNYLEAGTPLVILAGKEYGSGSSRDWAAKGPALLGVRAVIAESYERIHRSNLIGMGVLPLEFLPGQGAASLGLTGEEMFEITGVEALNMGGMIKTVRVRAGSIKFRATVRIDTETEATYFRHGGILPYVLRKLL
ncbi:aconitate hydratase AcnA [Castellaniella sp.]|uniref:aconitate hydratase AcnA n=1 Tax=Castellaniella sp. TaxID=1955812 RepID=UPI003A92AE8A